LVSTGFVIDGGVDSDFQVSMLNHLLERISYFSLLLVAWELELTEMELE
jgi:hypothetical protein